MSDLDRRLRIAREVGCKIVTDDVERILTEDGSTDVQACPGSGKTTLVGAKIAILLDGWERSGGILALSHTNVARDQILGRLAASTSGRAALLSPHFVGTIQAFVNRFLALPYLRGQGRPIEQIDDEVFASAAAVEMGRAGMHKVRHTLEMSRQPDAYARLQWGTSENELTLDGKKIHGFGPSTDTYKKLLGLKRRLSDRGIYRFGDMYFYASRYLDEFPWAIDTLRRRFPVVFIDEMQDTDAMQEALLNRLFAADAVLLQRYGDEDQGIYGVESDASSETSYPKGTPLKLGDSRRFGTFIASTITDVAPSRQKVFGDASISQAPHTVILFDRDTIKHVLPTFATLAHDVLGDKVNAIVKAVGYKRSQSSSESFPSDIGDYAPWLGIPQQSPRAYGDSFRARVVHARNELRTKPASPSSEWAEAFRALLRRWPVDDPTAVLRRIRADLATRRTLGDFGRQMLYAEDEDESLWQACVGRLVSFVSGVTRQAPNDAAKFFLRWTNAPGGKTAQDTENVPELALPVDVETIHAVKGETHDATLVLETRHHEYDVQVILEYLATKLAERRAIAEMKRIASHHRRMFVAMSRPRVLLCMAAMAEHVSNDVRAALAEQGWQIVDLTAQEPGPGSDQAS
jgi:DNA helicase-2/ATP-dependent DNA helicase PcrA